MSPQLMKLRNKLEVLWKFDIFFKKTIFYQFVDFEEKIISLYVIFS